MKAYGHERALVMHGTREGWRNAGRPWPTDRPEPVASTYPLPEAEVTQLMSLDALQGTLGSGDPVILDVRSDAEFAGERFWPSGATAGAGRPGHIPRAVHLNADLLRTADGAFQNAAEVRQLFEDLRVGPERGAVTYRTLGIPASEATP